MLLTSVTSSGALPVANFASHTSPQSETNHLLAHHMPHMHSKSCLCFPSAHKQKKLRLLSISQQVAPTILNAILDEFIFLTDPGCSVFIRRQRSEPSSRGVANSSELLQSPISSPVIALIQSLA